ncbi:MAG: DUF420 domain-containing protein [Putridiphycobacter sp.]|nr:DUF420 domain-containing protein [Putridiphycobacter sp.]
MTKNDSKTNSDLEKRYKPLVIALSIIIPLAVALLFGIKIEGYNFSFLPPIYATINGIVAILLVSAVIAIKNGNRLLHERLIKLAILGSVLFLVGYVIYHITSDTTYYGDINKDGILTDEERNKLGFSAVVYLFILFTHIILSVVIIPFVLFTYLRAWAGKFDRHKKLAKYTFPLWLYVAITGVVVYLLISPYYA